MGLDICVKKIVMLGDKNPQEIEDFYVMSEFPELEEKFGKFAFERENSYYDIEGELKKLGFNDIEKELEYKGYSHGEDTKFFFLNKKHPLFESFVFINGVWHQLYFDTKEELFNSEVYKEFKEKHLPLLIEHGWVEKYDFHASGNGRDYFNLNNANDFCKGKVELTLVNPGLIKKTERVFKAEEVGYQRKGANKKFYDDGMWDSPCVTDMTTLQKHCKEYFNKEEFTKNIIDNFVENQTFLIYC